MKMLEFSLFSFLSFIQYFLRKTLLLNGKQRKFRKQIINLDLEKKTILNSIIIYKHKFKNKCFLI